MKLLLRFVVALVAVVALAAFVLFQMPGEDVFRLFEKQIEAALGRDVSISGEITTTATPRPGIRATGLVVANADWSETGPMLEADGLFIGIEWASIFRGEVEITQVELENPVIRLERAADGRVNWALAEPEEDIEAEPPVIPAVVALTGADLRYTDHADGTSLHLQNLDATLDVPDPAGAAQFDLSAQMNGQPVALSGQIAEFAGLLDGGVGALNLTATAGGSRAQFDGRGGISPLVADGTLDADLADMAAAFGAFGLAAPDLPVGLGRKVGVKGAFSYTEDGNLHLRGGTLRLDQNVLSGSADLSLNGARPRLNGQFAAAALDFSGFSSADSTPGWSKTALDVSGLHAFDGELSLTAEAIDIGLLKFDSSRVSATFDRGRVVFGLREVAAYGGQVTGEFVVNARGGLSVRGNLNGQGLASQPMLVDLAEFDRLSGPLNAEVALLGSGNSVNALMNSLSGTGAIAVGAGKLRGLDLVGMLSNIKGAFANRGAETNFDSIDATFTIDGGVLRNNDLSLVGPRVTATGQGTVGIGAQTVDFRVVPVALTAEGLGGKSVPLVITGPWSDLRYRPDLKAIVDEEFSDEKTAVEEEVKKAVEEKLGVTPEEGESVEDALKKKLEDEAKKGLLKLLER